MEAALGQLAGQAQQLGSLDGEANGRRVNIRRCPRLSTLDVDISVVGNCYPDHGTGDDPNLLKIVEANSYPRKRSANMNSNDRTPSSGLLELNEEIWRELPEELLEYVLTKIPISSLFRFRAVCKKWDSLLRSGNYYKQHAGTASGHPWILTLTSESGKRAAMYDPNGKCWHHLPKPYLHAVRLMAPVASAGGLVCFRKLGYKNFLICNPLTRITRELPSNAQLAWVRLYIGMALNGSTAESGYKVVSLEPWGAYETYDSSSNCWERMVVPEGITLPISLITRSLTLSVGSTIYIMRDSPDGILSYDVAGKIWNEFRIPFPPDLIYRRLAEFDGKVMLVGLVVKNAATCVCVWELQRMTLLWKEVDRMPNAWCLEFYGKNVRMECVGNRGLLLLSLRARRLTRLVTYDMRSRQWEKAPDCWIPGTRRKLHMSWGVAFDPCPAAVA